MVREFIQCVVDAVDPAGWTQKDSDMLLDYTDGAGSTELNGALRDGKLTDAQKFRVDGVNDALDKLPNHQGWVTRRVNSDEVPPEYLKSLQEGNTVTEDAFTSSSKSPKAAFQGDVEIRVYSKTGKDISQYAQSTSQREEEVLFKSGTPFNVLKRFEENGKLIIVESEA
jgi:hypothetical protein